MSRSGYIDASDYDDDNLELGRWRGQVTSAIRGKRGQKLLTDLLKALDEMPDKRLIAEELETEDGDVCALGALGKVRGMKLQDIDPEDYDQVAEAFGVAHQLAQEIMYLNDEWPAESPEQRWNNMRAWVAKQITPCASVTSSEGTA